MSIYERYEQFADKTFQDAADKYLSEFTGKCRMRQWYALEHILPYIATLPLIDVDDTAIATYKQERAKVAMVGTINKEIATATAVLNKAAKVWRWIPSAPLLQRVKGKSKQPYPLAWSEQIDVFKRMVGILQKICLFAVNTGVRREEIFKLKWEDERDIDGVKLFILRDTKNGQDRPVILNSIARRVVEQMRGWDSPSPITGEKGDPVYVFPRMTVNKVFNLAWKMAGLPDDKYVKKGIHNLRHTFGHRLRAAGVPAEDRDALLGHHSRSLTQHYALPDIQRLAQYAELVTVRNDVPVLR
jgi:integrase